MNPEEKAPTVITDAEETAAVSPNAARITRGGTVISLFGAEIRVWEPPTSGAALAELQIVADGGATFTAHANRAMIRALGKALGEAARAGDSQCGEEW